MHHTLLSKRDIPPLKPRMPITPFHLGPGAAFKAIGGRHFSFVVFGGAPMNRICAHTCYVALGWARLHEKGEPQDGSHAQMMYT